MWGLGLDLSGSECVEVVRTCEYGDEISGSIKHGEFVEKLTNR